MDNHIFNFQFAASQTTFSIPLDPSLSFQKNKLTISPCLFLRPKILTEIVKKIKDHQNQKFTTNHQDSHSFLNNFVKKLEKKINDSDEEFTSEEFSFFLNALQFIIAGQVRFLFL